MAPTSPVKKVKQKIIAVHTLCIFWSILFCMPMLITVVTMWINCLVSLKMCKYSWNIQWSLEHLFPLNISLRYFLKYFKSCVFYHILLRLSTHIADWTCNKNEYWETVTYHKHLIYYPTISFQRRGQFLHLNASEAEETRTSIAYLDSRCSWIWKGRICGIPEEFKYSLFRNTGNEKGATFAKI